MGKINSIEVLREMAKKAREMSATLAGTNLDIYKGDLDKLAVAIDFEIEQKLAWQVEESRPYYGG